MMTLIMMWTVPRMAMVGRWYTLLFRKWSCSLGGEGAAETMRCTASPEMSLLYLIRSLVVYEAHYRVTHLLADRVMLTQLRLRITSK